MLCPDFVRCPFSPLAFYFRCHLRFQESDATRNRTRRSTADEEPAVAVSSPPVFVASEPALSLPNVSRRLLCLWLHCSLGGRSFSSDITDHARSAYLCAASSAACRRLRLTALLAFHFAARSSSARFHFPAFAPASYVLSQNAIKSRSGDADARKSSYIKKNSFFCAL
jgi:hypothetical protein